VSQTGEDSIFVPGLFFYIYYYTFKNLVQIMLEKGPIVVSLVDICIVPIKETHWTQRRPTFPSSILVLCIYIAYWGVDITASDVYSDPSTMHLHGEAESSMRRHMRHLYNMRHKWIFDTQTLDLGRLDARYAWPCNYVDPPETLRRSPGGSIRTALAPHHTHSLGRSVVGV